MEDHCSTIQLKLVWQDLVALSIDERPTKTRAASAFHIISHAVAYMNGLVRIERVFFEGTVKNTR